MEGRRLPDVVLLEIFSCLSLEELLKARFVCKHWKSLIQTDVVWNRFIQRWNLKELGVELESSESEASKGSFKTVLNVWNSSSIKYVGKERWYSLPFPKLWEEYEYRLREAEQTEKGGQSSTNMYLRLNPSHEFTTKGNNTEDEEMRKACEEMWYIFGDDENGGGDIENYEDSMKNAHYRSKHSIMTNILRSLDPEWFSEGLGWDPYSLDADCNIINANDNQEPNSEGYDEELPPPQYMHNLSKRLPERHWQDIKTVFAEYSERFIEYYMSEGCIDENLHYGRFLYISDTAVYYLVQYYDL